MSEQEKKEENPLPIPSSSGVVDTGRRIEIGSLKKPNQKTFLRHSSAKPKVSAPSKEETPTSSSPASTQIHVNGHHKEASQKPKAFKPHRRLEKTNKKGDLAGFQRPAPASQKPPLTLSSSPPLPLLVRPEPVEFDDSGDFGALLDAFGPIKRETLSIGNHVKGRVVHISQDFAFLALGQRLEGTLSLSELKDAQGNLTVSVGDSLEAYVVSVEDGIKLSKKMGQGGGMDLGMLENAKANQIPVEGKILSVNKGGVEVAIGNARAFCPIGQLGMSFIEDPSLLVGSTQSFLVTQLSNNGRNIVLSRRILLEKERAHKQQNRLATLHVGDVVEGTVSRVAEFGAFVELDGIEALIPVSEMSHGRVIASDIVNVGDKVTAEVIKIEPDTKRPDQMRVALSLKTVAPDPIETHGVHIYAGSVLTGKVVRLQGFGAFIELFPGIDGLVHISEISHKRIRHPEEVLKVGDEVTVRVLDVDFGSRRISLSLKSETEAPEAPARKGKEGPSAQEESDNIGRYLSNMNASSKSLGTFADLLKKR